MAFSRTATVTNSAKKTKSISMLGVKRAQRTSSQTGNMIGHLGITKKVTKFTEHVFTGLGSGDGAATANKDKAEDPDCKVGKNA